MAARAAVTGAFSYSGQYIARSFLQAGWDVRTLTRRPQRPHALQGTIPAFPLDFTRADELERSLRGVDVLANTYWVRFNYTGSSFTQAVENTAILLNAARAAGVRRIVHLSVSNANAASDLPYYSGKAAVEELIQRSGLSYCILRPTLIFGDEEVLVNNIAWLLRRLPVFAIPGDGEYRLQPIYVEDLAQLALQNAQSAENITLDAGGPEVFTYTELVRLLRELLGRRTLLVHLPPELLVQLARLLGFLLGDVLLTRQELLGLMREHLYVGLPGAGQTSFAAWARQHAQTLGRSYANELRRHHDRGGGDG